MAVFNAHAVHNHTLEASLVDMHVHAHAHSLVYLWPAHKSLHTVATSAMPALHEPEPEARLLTSTCTYGLAYL